MPQLAAEGSDWPHQLKLNGTRIHPFFWDSAEVQLVAPSRTQEQVFSRSLNPTVLTHWEAFLHVMPQSQPHNLAGCFLGYPCTAQYTRCHMPSKL